MMWCAIWAAVFPPNMASAGSRHMMAAWRGGAELDLMRRIKTALDPQGLMNPGKVLP